MLEEEILEEIEKENEKKESQTPNEIVEIDENSNTTMYDMKEIHEESKKKSKKKKESKWSTLDRKQKTIIIVVSVLLLVVIIGVLLYIFVFKKDKTEDKDKKPDEPIVIVEKDNYRYENGKLVFMSKTKEDLGEYECKNKSEELCYVAYYSDEDTFDVEQHVYEDGKKIETRSDLYNNQYVFIFDNDSKTAEEIILYDFKENKELETYKLVKEINDEKAIVKNAKDKYGIIDLSDAEIEEILDFKYDYLGCMKNEETIVAKNNLNYYLLDSEGKEVTKSIPGEIKNYNDNYISVMIENDYYLYDYKGAKKIDTDYDYITFKDDYILAVDSKKIYAFDSEVNPLNKDGIRINSTNYNTKVTFDENKKQVKKEVPFEVDITRDKMIFRIDEEEKTINIYEGKLSAKEDYISYFDGTLYIYSDEAKTNLLGTYKCSNANVVDASSTEFSNCFIAKESILLNRKNTSTNKVGNIPIFNKRYIFIKDNDTAKTKDNIILWDLKQNKQQANYSEADTGFYDNSKNVNFVDTASTLVLARNTSGSLGIIRIENNNLTGIIPFKDNNEEIRYLKDLFLVKRSDGTYHLFNTTGTDFIKSDIRSEIVDYNDGYVQVKTNDEYAIYSLDGKVVSTGDSFMYVKLYEAFFIGINKEKQINIYTFDGTNLTKDEETDMIVMDNIENGYKVSAKGSNVELDILDENGVSVKNFKVNIGAE